MNDDYRVRKVQRDDLEFDATIMRAPREPTQKFVCSNELPHRFLYDTVSHVAKHVDSGNTPRLRPSRPPGRAPGRHTEEPRLSVGDHSIRHTRRREAHDDVARVSKRCEGSGHRLAAAQVTR